MYHTSFQPDYRNIVDAARRIRPRRLPLYEHNVYPNVLEPLIGKKFADLAQGDPRDKKEYFSIFCGALAELGHDVVPFERCVVELVQGGEGLCGRVGPSLRTGKLWRSTIGMDLSRHTLSVSALERRMKGIFGF